jgi:hypothetical protein
VTTGDLTAGGRSHSLAEIEDCAIAVDATYYLQYFLDTPPYHEPLLAALAGLTGIEAHIQRDLEAWQTNNIIPFFIFDGQAITGQDDVSVAKARQCNKRTDDAWNLYFSGEAKQAVDAFGRYTGRQQAEILASVRH